MTRKIFSRAVIFCLLPVCAWAMEIHSTGFKEGERVPSRYTCDGDDTSPELKWSNVPDDAKILVLLCEDVDSPKQVWSHWVIFNIPAADIGIGMNFLRTPQTPAGAFQGLNDYGRLGYSGPCPPPDGGPHRYFFKLYALDVLLTLDNNAVRQDVLDAMEGHVLAYAQTFGIYSR